MWETSVTSEDLDSGGGSGLQCGVVWCGVGLLKEKRINVRSSMY